MNGTPWPWSRPARLGRVAPLPFVAVSTILVALLLFTPVLLSSGTSVYLAQGQLIVDSVAGANWTKIYVQPLDPHAIRYASIALDLGSGFVWNGSCPSSVTRWTNSSATNQIELYANSTANPLLVYATAVYNDTSGPVVFAGAFALDLQGAPGPAPTLTLAPCVLLTPGVTVPSTSYAFTDLQLTLSLVDFGSGGPP
jgi:hypothetical protein